jgi:hypothetical protein
MSIKMHIQLLLSTVWTLVLVLSSEFIRRKLKYATLMEDANSGGNYEVDR